MGDLKQKTILLVADEAAIAKIEKRQLENDGYKVIHSFTGKDAAQIVSAQKPPVDLILMDIDLKNGFDGTMTAREILENDNAPVVFLSSILEKEIVKRTKKISYYGYVARNSGKITLLASIKTAFRLFESENDEKMEAPRGRC